MVRRSAVIVEPATVTVTAPRPEKPRCASCGVGLPNAHQGICSFCKCDPFYGSDGYLLDMIEEAYAAADSLPDVKRDIRRAQLAPLMRPTISKHPMRIRMFAEALDMGTLD